MRLTETRRSACSIQLMHCLSYLATLVNALYSLLSFLTAACRLLFDKLCSILYLWHDFNIAKHCHEVLSKNYCWNIPSWRKFYLYSSKFINLLLNKILQIVFYNFYKRFVRYYYHYIFMSFLKKVSQKQITNLSR